MLKKLFLLLLFTIPFAEAQDVAVDGTKKDEEIASESAFIMGMKEYMAENYAKAAELFKGVLDKSDATAGMYHMLAKSYSEIDDLNESAAAAKATLDLEETLYYQKFYAAILASLQDYDQALGLYKKIIRKYPLDIESYILSAEIHESLGEYDAAIKLYDRVEKNIGAEEAISHRKQQLYLKQNNVDAAIKEGNRLIENQPLEAEYVLKQAQIMISNQKLAAAEKLLVNYLKGDPNLAEGHVILADIYRQQGDLRACNKELQLAFENKGLEPEIKLQVLGSYVKLVEDNPDTENVNQAIELTQKLIDEEPELAPGYIYMGDLLMKKGRLEEARLNYLKSTEYDKSIFEVWLALVELDTKLNDTDALVKDAGSAAEYFPNQAFFWYHYGYGNVLRRDFDEAIYALDEARNLAFDNEELLKHILALLGDSYNANKEYSESENAYDEVLEIDPNYEIVLNNYSYFLALRKRKLDKASELSRHLVSLSPHNVNYIDTHAWVLFQKEDYLEAQKAIESAIHYEDDVNGTVLEHYGDILFKLGDKTAALEQWKKAKALGENSIHIDQKILEQQYIE